MNGRCFIGAPESDSSFGVDIGCFALPTALEGESNMLCIRPAISAAFTGVLIPAKGDNTLVVKEERCFLRGDGWAKRVRRAGEVIRDVPWAGGCKKGLLSPGLGQNLADNEGLRRVCALWGNDIEASEPIARCKPDVKRPEYSDIAQC